MKIRCVWEHKGEDSLLYADNFVGAYTRGASRDEAIRKMTAEVASYLAWKGEPAPEGLEPVIVQEKATGLTVADADSDVIFDEERWPLRVAEYAALKALALKSAQDFLTLYEAIPDKHKSCLPVRNTFYGQVPRTAFEMYEHTKNVNDFYFREIGISADHEGSILDCRRRGFALVERKSGYLENRVFVGSYREEWSLRKVIRRFIWHDRIHAKAMCRMSIKTLGITPPDIFHFGDLEKTVR